MKKCPYFLPDRRRVVVIAQNIDLARKHFNLDELEYLKETIETIKTHTSTPSGILAFYVGSNYTVIGDSGKLDPSKEINSLPIVPIAFTSNGRYIKRIGNESVVMDLGYQMNPSVTMGYNFPVKETDEKGEEKEFLIVTNEPTDGSKQTSDTHPNVHQILLNIYHILRVSVYDDNSSREDKKVGEYSITFTVTNNVILPNLTTVILSELSVIDNKLLIIEDFFNPQGTSHQSFTNNVQTVTVIDQDFEGLINRAKEAMPA
jgi:hypothetical protein